MHLLKKIFSATTGYWIHKESTLPIGADLFLDIHSRIRYGSIKTMFDVGANVGQTWEWFRANEQAAKVYCFEPIDGAFKLLAHKTQGDKNCIIEKIAFGESITNRTIKLFASEHSALNSLNDGAMNPDRDAKTENIVVNTVDNYCATNEIDTIDFLKIDTEGYELKVLSGAREMLASARISFIYCEVGFLAKNKRNTNLSELTEWLAHYDYYFYGLYQLVTNGWKEGDYFGNALFIHKDIFQP